MSWTVIFHEEFAPEFEKFNDDVKDAIFVRAGLLELEGPQLMRPYADTRFTEHLDRLDAQ